MNLKYDPGETPSSIQEFWLPDKECKSVPVDPWTCRNIPLKVQEKAKNFLAAPKVRESLDSNEKECKIFNIFNNSPSTLTPQELLIQEPKFPIFIETDGVRKKCVFPLKFTPII